MELLRLYFQTSKTLKDNTNLTGYTPHDYQQTFISLVSDNIVWDNNSCETPLNEKSFYLYLKQGLGKTDCIAMALQKTPLHITHGTVNIVCHKTLLGYWKHHLLSYPQLVFDNKTKFRIIGYDEYHKRILADPLYVQNDVVVVDEAQRFRNVSEASVYDIESFTHCRYIFYLSGTPLVNQPTDLHAVNMLMGNTTITSLNNIKKFPNEYPDHKIPTTAKEYMQLYINLKNRIFYYEPDEQLEIPTENIDFYVPMTILQQFHYIKDSSQKTTFGIYPIISAVRNSYESRSRRIGNCLQLDNPRRLISPKFDKIVDFVKECVTKPDRSGVPIVIYSQFLELGVVALYNLIRENSWSKALNIILMTSETTSEQRDMYQQQFENGEVDILLMSKICETGMNLPDSAAIVVAEVPESSGDQGQIVCRVKRAAAKRKRPNMIPKLVRFISTFLKTKPSKEEANELNLYFAKYMNASNPESILKEMKEEKMDLVDCVMEMGNKLQMTADEKRAIRNIEKEKHLQNEDLMIKTASIEHKDIPSRFYEKARQLTKNNSIGNISIKK
jgi:superfamily II DNA or RNA helicase